MFQEINKYLSRGIYPFHMPGHKRNADFFPPNLHSFDITEIPEMDVLSAPTGIIKKFSERISSIYGSKESFFLTNGASAGIAAAICAACTENTVLFAPRNAHVSLYNGLIFSGAKPMYYLPETENGLAVGVSPDVFDNMPQGAVAFVVSPAYEGFISDIETISKKVHARGGLLIVDEAHGAHFAFHDYFPKTALQQGADIVINSLHKTLPAVSGCAVLHVREGSAELPKLRFYINAMQTTSPSYMLMAGCDFMLDKLTPQLFEEYVSRLKRFRQNASGCALSLENRYGIIDAGKLLFSLNSESSKIAEIAAREYGIQFEMSRGRHILAMTSAADTDEGFLRLERAVKGIKNIPCSPLPENKPIILPEIVMTPREAMHSETEETQEAIGRISAELIADYPPGIALAVPGERINIPISKPLVRVVRE
jgi:arginine/lysine/ornithine decarboxylase